MYHYTLSGLDNIWLKNGYQEHEYGGQKGISIHDLDGLHRKIALSIVNKKAPISAKEFKFLRIEMDMSQKLIGDLMGKSDQMIAHWEKGNSAIPVLADKAIRDLYMESIGGSPIAGLLGELKDLDRQLHDLKIQLEETGDGWGIQDLVAA